MTYLIEQEKYFILHAPRQTGKTSSLLALMAYLNKQDRFKCLYINIEGVTWDEKIFRKQKMVNNKTITIWGM